MADYALLNNSEIIIMMANIFKHLQLVDCSLSLSIYIYLFIHSFNLYHTMLSGLLRPFHR